MTVAPSQRAVSTREKLVSDSAPSACLHSKNGEQEMGDSEASWLRDHTWIDRLLLALFLAVWWVSHLAASCLHHGHRARFDRADRRDKSIVRLGRLWLLDVLRRIPASLFAAATLTWCLPFRRRAAGWAFSLRF